MATVFVMLPRVELAAHLDISWSARYSVFENSLELGSWRLDLFAASHPRASKYL